MNEALQNLLTRRACRAYREEQIKPEELDSILEVGQYAPTGQGDHGHLPRRHGDTDITDTQVGTALGYGRVSFFVMRVENFIIL